MSLHFGVKNPSIQGKNILILLYFFFWHLEVVIHPLSRFITSSRTSEGPKLRKERVNDQQIHWDSDTKESTFYIRRRHRPI